MKSSLPLAIALLLPHCFSPAVSAKLVAWYPLDEPPASSSTAATENIDENNAPAIGLDPDPAFSLVERGHTPASQNLGSAYRLTKGGGLELGIATEVQPTDKFTISFWFQLGTETDAFDRFLESQLGNGNDQHGLRIDTGGSGAAVRVLVRSGNAAGNTQFQHPTQIKKDGTWYFFAFRYDSAGIDNAPFQVTVIEADGSAVDEAAMTAATAGPATLNTGALLSPHAQATFMGLQDAAAGIGNALDGSLDEIAFFDNSDGSGVLTDQQLTDVYNFGPSGVQLISSFTTDLVSVAPGSPATLAWEVSEPFDSLLLDDGLGNSTDLAPLTAGGAGTIEVSPTTTTSYSIRATRGEAANVFTIRILAGAAPDISSFTASAPLIQAGETVDLTWSVAGADSVTLNPGAADVSGVNTIEVSPAETTTYTLSATNGFGTTDAEVTVNVIDGPVPANRYFASFGENLDNTWIDEVGDQNWNLTGALRESPLVTPSPNTNISATYSTGGGISGGSTGTFSYPEFSAEIWLRPGTLAGASQVLFESGGGQNGVSALISEDGLRFLGSIGDARTLDLNVPLDGLNLDDFIQLVFSTSAGSDAFEVSIRDTFGTVRTASAVADLVIGNNGAGLFIQASGALGGDINLGGRTEDPAADPGGEDLVGFTGEIAILNIYDRILETSDIEDAFNSIATTVDPPTEIPFAITQIEVAEGNSSMTLTWNSIEEHLYDAQFSVDLQSWFELDDTTTATGPETTKTYNIPPGRSQFFLRIIDLGLD